MLSRKVCVALVLLVVACNGGADGGRGDAATKDAGPAMSCSDAGAGTSFPCDVAPIIASKCQRCHDTTEALSDCLAQGSCVQGPFPLLTWSDTRRQFATGRVIDFLADVIDKRIMPLTSVSVQPPVQPLTDGERSTLLAWARSCAPPSTKASCP